MFGEELDNSRELIIATNDLHAVSVMEPCASSYLAINDSGCMPFFKTGRYIKYTIKGNHHYSHGLPH